MKWKDILLTSLLLITLPTGKLSGSKTMNGSAKKTIDANRQSLLLKHIQFNYNDKHLPPFKGINLCRLDIEWLILTYLKSENPDRNSYWNNKGLDLRGAILEGILSNLPLDGMNGENVNFQNAVLAHAQMNDAILRGVHLEGMDLTGAHLERAILDGTNLSDAILVEAHLESASLLGAGIHHAYLAGAFLVNAQLRKADLRDADLQAAQLQGAEFNQAHLEGANISRTNVAYPTQNITQNQSPTNLQGAIFDASTELTDIDFGDGKLGYALLADIRWGGVSLAQVPALKILAKRFVVGEEYKVRCLKKRDERRELYEEAVRANHQLSVALRDQGMTVQADHFAYHAQVCQRKAFYLQKNLGRYVWSKFLDILSGYGYRPMNTVIWYIVIISVFTCFFEVYGSFDHYVSFNWRDAIVFSIASFHGRGFFPGTIPLHNPVDIIAAVEAVFGLFIEISFIATFSQRYFGK